MKKGLIISGETPVKFMEKYNETIELLDGAEIISEKFLTYTYIYQFYDSDDVMDPDEQIEQIRQRAEAAFREKEPDFIVDAIDDEADDVQTISIELKINIPRNRFCCECRNYNWSKGCHYRDGMVRQMDKACPLFDVILGREEE